MRDEGSALEGESQRHRDIESAEASDWVYLKLYLGEAFDRCDAVIVFLLPQILRLEGIQRWFFLRYTDERGFHLRLRLRTASSGASALSEQATRLCQRTLQRLLSFPPSDYYPMVPPSSGRFFEAPPGATTGIEADRYEPEYEKFGGTRGMPIAEELFEVSSRIAVDIVSAEDRGSVSRKTLAPCLMQAVANAFEIDTVEFWQDYSFYWLGARTPLAHDTRRRFFEKGQTLHESGIPIVAPQSTLHETARNFIEKWRHAVRAAARAYARTVGDLTTDVLAFNFAHLMNNRIGLYPLDEAYLAALLEQRAKENFAA